MVNESRGLNFTIDDIDWPKRLPFEEYLGYARNFLQIDGKEFDRLFNSLPRNLIRELLFKFSFVEYAKGHINKKDKALKTLCLIFFVEGVAEKGNGGSKERFVAFFRDNLEMDGKKRLISAYKFSAKGQSCSEVCLSECRNERCLGDKDCSYLNNSNIGSYLDKVVERIYEMRCCIVHDGLITFITGNVFDAYWNPKKGALESYYCKIDFVDFESIVRDATLKYLQTLAFRK